MDEILKKLNAAGIDLPDLLIACGILLLAFLVISFLGRVIFGKDSTLSRSASSAIAVVFIYASAVVLYVFYPALQKYIAPLPMVEFIGDKLVFFSFKGADFTVISTQLVNMIILTFLVNLADRWIPCGKHFISWLLYRILTVLLAMAMHLVATGLLAHFLPEGIMAYSATILLIILALTLITGFLKIIAGVALTVLNPVIGIFYTFFFDKFIGKLITRAVVSTALLSGLIYALGHFGTGAISIGSAALVAYIPLLALLFALWYLIKKVF